MVLNSALEFYNLTMISIVVGAAGLVVGVIQLVLYLIQYHENKKNRH